MKHLLLERPRGLAAHDETQGFLSFPSQMLATIERPWIEGLTPGGKPFESCVPDGVYQLRLHTRPDPDPTDDKPPQEVVALINETLGVYYLEEDLPPEGGRFLILIHIANWSSNVVGCIGPGLGKADSADGPMVTSSKAAMKKVMDYIDGDSAEIEIRWI